MKLEYKLSELLLVSQYTTIFECIRYNCRCDENLSLHVSYLIDKIMEDDNIDVITSDISKLFYIFKTRLDGSIICDEYINSRYFFTFIEFILEKYQIELEDVDDEYRKFVGKLLIYGDYILDIKNPYEMDETTKLYKTWNKEYNRRKSVIEGLLDAMNNIEEV